MDGEISGNGHIYNIDNELYLFGGSNEIIFTNVVSLCKMRISSSFQILISINTFYYSQDIDEHKFHLFILITYCGGFTFLFPFGSPPNVGVTHGPIVIPTWKFVWTVEHDLLWSSII